MHLVSAERGFLEREQLFETLREAGVDMPNETVRPQAVEVKASLSRPEGP